MPSTAIVVAALAADGRSRDARAARPCGRLNVRYLLGLNRSIFSLSSRRVGAQVDVLLRATRPSTISPIWGCMQRFAARDAEPAVRHTHRPP